MEQYKDVTGAKFSHFLEISMICLTVENNRSLRSKLALLDEPFPTQSPI